MVFCKQFCTDFTKPNVRMFDTLTPLSHHQDTHLIILFAPVHRGSWKTPVSRVDGDWSHLLFSSSQRLIFLLRSSQTISLFLSHYVSVIKNTKRPKYKLIIPFYFIKKSIFYRNRPIFEYQNLNIELFGRFDVSDIDWSSNRHLVHFNLLAIDRKIIAQNDCHNNQTRSTSKYSFVLKLDHVSPFPVFYQVSHCLPASNILAHQLINLLTGFGIL